MTLAKLITTKKKGYGVAKRVGGQPAEPGFTRVVFPSAPDAPDTRNEKAAFSIGLRLGLPTEAEGRALRPDGQF